MGYTALNAFVKKGTLEQPHDPNMQEYALNVGMFQLPLFYGKPGEPAARDRAGIHLFYGDPNEQVPSGCYVLQPAASRHNLLGYVYLLLVMLFHQILVILIHQLKVQIPPT